MPVFSSSEHLYAVLKDLFERVHRRTPNPIDALYSSKLTIRLRLSAPAGEVSINGRTNPALVQFGGNSARPELDVELNADTLHKILLDELSLKKAVATRQMKVLGPVWKTNSLGAILEAGRAIYPQVLKDFREDFQSL